MQYLPKHVLFLWKIQAHYTRRGSINRYHPTFFLRQMLVKFSLLICTSFSTTLLHFLTVFITLYGKTTCTLQLPLATGHCPFSAPNPAIKSNFSHSTQLYWTPRPPIKSSTIQLVDKYDSSLPIIHSRPATCRRWLRTNLTANSKY